MALTKTDITDMISQSARMTGKEAKAVVDSVFDLIKDELTKGNPVKISGFGKWNVKSKHARIGRNPQTGEELEIAARNVLTFKSSNVMREAVNYKK